ncbi:MAG: exosome complex protein Rrp42 [Candidatus Woesearchaeota archaeon]
MNEELKVHMIEALKQDIRFDGRKAEEFRDIELETGVTNTAEGSAKVKIGETEVFAGVKMELGTPYPDKPDEGTIMVGAELIPLSNPEFEAGPPTIQGVELARVVDRGIREGQALNFKELCIKPGEKCWIVSIDIVSLNDAGNLIDASALASLAAIMDTKLPEIKDGAVDYKHKTEKGLNLTKFPIAVTVIKIGDSFLIDPTSEEEKAIDARLTVTTTEDGKICSLQKGGSAPLSLDQIDRMIGIAIKNVAQLRKVLK